MTHWEGPPLDAWEPWRPGEVAARLSGIAAPWCVVGGWAIDLFLGRETRLHGDLEIGIPRSTFAEVRDRLSEFAMHSVGGGEVRALAADALPPRDKHQNWVRDRAANAWRMDVMLEPGDAETWICRRDESIRGPRAAMIGMRDSVPFLVPEAVLLFKAKAARTKDEADFSATLPHLSDAARAWLRRSLEQLHPEHAWIARL